ncbi:hypothetical protein PBI_LAUER_21 [Gordonia phage Lauer]|uniref:Holin n=1 Tax=Gordonia phage Lauer TaxID=2656538 RepID=A0A649VIC7_9CAUD|nr:holin [Gordonia phage Lauer]QGJ92130.1 hypothetical protein PBI_LAUER_21 [Gordonia phage Lauer]
MTHRDPATRTVFGREPAAWTGLVTAAIVLLTSFGIAIDTDTQGYIIAAVEAVLGVVVVIAVRETVYPALTALVRAAIPLVVALGLDLTIEQQGAILALSTVLLSFVATRPQVTPQGV